MLFNCLALGKTENSQLIGIPDCVAVLFLVQEKTAMSISFDRFVFVFVSIIGFYTMRMLEPNTAGNAPSVSGATVAASLTGNTASMIPAAVHGATADRLDASSDSAVSSMGSERVPSLSDSEWGDGGSDSAQEYHHR